MDEPQRPTRRFPRYHTDLDVTVSRGSLVSRSQITQISQGGCLIYPPLSAQESPEVRLSFRLDAGLPPINCKGEIVYTVVDKGTGTAFTEISPYNQDLITQHFKQKSVA